MKFFIQIIPIVSAAFVALIWAAFYLFSENMHGMQVMFNEQFPFLIAAILDLQPSDLSFTHGIFLAGLDGFIIGLFLGWIVRKLLS